MPVFIPEINLLFAIAKPPSVIGGVQAAAYRPSYQITKAETLDTTKCLFEASS